MNRRRGLALIVVVGVLGVLAVVAVAFVTMAQLERKASQQRVNAAKAYLLARSGIEDALARLGMGQDPEADQNRYQGENWDGDPNAALSAYEAANELYHVTGTGTSADTDACPVRDAMRPSFFVGVPTAPSVVTVDGRDRGFSGSLGGDQRSWGNTYAIKVSLGGAGFFINGGDPSFVSNPATMSDYNLNLRRMLGILADAVDREPDGVSKGSLTRADGENLIALRPATGWQSFAQVRDVALGGSQAKLDALKPYLTLHAWVDKRVVRPNANDERLRSLDVYSNPDTWGKIKLLHMPNPSAANSRAPDFERIKGRIVGRAPVSLAWARHRRPALIALLADLEALHLSELYQSNDSGGDAVGNVFDHAITLDWTAPNDPCRTAVSALLTTTSELATWQEWDDWCNSYNGPFAGAPYPGANTTIQARRDILRANFNPNSDLNKFGPNPLMWKSVDKSDLLVYSTEFGLLPTQGWDLECVGRVLGPGGRLLAVRTLTVSLAGPGVVRLSTQKDFVCGDLGDLDTPGDERDSRRPGYSVGGVSAYLSQSQGTGKTWGHTLNTQSPAALYPPANYASSWMKGKDAGGVGLSNGAGLQVYPEPYYDDQTGVSGLWMNPADYDGNLQLATVETVKDDPYTVRSPPNQMMMLARFDDGFDLDVAAGGNAACQADVSMARTAELGNSLWHASKPGTLYPDGAYSEKGRAPAYLDRGNSNGFHGVVSFWIKPNYGDLFVSGAGGGYGAVRGRPYLRMTNFSATGRYPSSPRDQFFMLSQGDGTSDGNTLTLFFETCHRADESNHQHEFRLTTLSPPAPSWWWPLLAPHQWALVTFYWDSVTRNKDNCGELLLNDTPSFSNNGSNDVLPGSSGNPPAAAEDITLDDISPATGLSGPHEIVLGRLSARCPVDLSAPSGFVGGGADATFDEFAIWDFGGASYAGVGHYSDASDASLGSSATLAQNRYREGRYYKGAVYKKAWDASLVSDEAGSWISAPLSLPPGYMISRIAWTWRRPASLPDDFAEVELLNGAVTDYLAGRAASRSTLAAGFNVDSQSWDSVNLAPSSPFRARVIFRRKDGSTPALSPASTSVDDHTPILESPVFDDLTILYQPGGGTKILAWGDGER